jgi:nucleoside-diphosphate-sugar epimerase
MLQSPSLHATDLREVLDTVHPRWEKLRGQKILVTGGTGIIGKWLIETLLHANSALELDVSIYLLSRAPDSFRARYPTLAADRHLTLLHGDVRTFELPKRSHFSHVIHAATDVVNPASGLDTLDTCFNGTRRVIAQARAAGAQRMLFLSSGAVYGKTPTELHSIPEDFQGTLDCLSPESAYAQGKRSAELVCAVETAKGDIVIPIARCFAMVGPFLPLDKHFAIGNFIEAVLKNEPIMIRGDGTPIRSYLYMSDVVSRLWLLLLDGRAGAAYNVGGHQPITIKGLAQRVVTVLDSSVSISVVNESVHGAHSNTYVPDTTRIQTEFSLGPSISLNDAILRTAAWYRPLYT